MESIEAEDENLSESNSIGYKSLSSSFSDTSEPLATVISDAGVYSLCGLCALTFNQLFSDDENKAYCERTINCLIQHLRLPSKIENTMKALLDGEGGNVNDFIELLKKEPILEHSCIRVVECLVIFAVKEGIYDARLRTLIVKVSELLNVPLPLVELYEESVVDMLSNDLPPETDEQVKEKTKRLRNKKIKKYFMIGLAGLSGGAIIGLTGGLAAPFVAAGAGAIIGGAGAAALGSTAGIAVIGSLFGVAGAGLTGYKMKKRVGDIEEFAFDTLTVGRELHLTIAISGWISEEGPKAFHRSWLNLRNSREQYCIRYESKYLLELGRALDYFLSFVVSMAAQEALKYTILSGLMAAVAWPAALVTFASVIDNPWGVCIRRSAEVGKHLAEILITRQQGKRPVTLIGFSLGARVIFYCLQEMSQRKGCEGIIEDVVLLGAPVSGNVNYWKAFEKIVSGRIINGYCRGDWLLKFLYRTSTATIKIAGLAPINWSNRRMINIDLSDIVKGHMDYASKMSRVLKAVGIRVEFNENENNEMDNEGANLRKCFSDFPLSSPSYYEYNEYEDDYELKYSKDDGSINDKNHINRSRKPFRLRRNSNPCYSDINIKYILPRRSSSLESILSRLSLNNNICLSSSQTLIDSISLNKISLSSSATEIK